MSRFRNTIGGAVTIAALSLPLAASAEGASVVLVHGAFSNSAAWDKVIPILQDAGVSVSAAHLGLSALKADADTVTRLLDLQDGPVVLVGHSYGGSVITEAGAHPKVDHLVYIAGFALEAGQSLADLTEGQPPAPWQAELYPDADGYLRLTETGIAQFFAPDLAPADTAVMAATQGPLNYATTQHAPSVAAWSVKPTSYVIAQHDQIISPKVQGYFAQKMGAEVTSVATSHVAMLADPDAVASVILAAVQDLSSD